MKQISFRLKSGQLLFEEIEKKVKENGVKAGVLLSIVAGLDNARLRMAGSDADNQTVKQWNEPFEVVSGTGTVSLDGCHIHVSLSDKNGKVIGGHLKDGCVVKYTAEIVIGIFDGVVYKRIFDEETGFKELEVV